MKVENIIIEKLVADFQPELLDVLNESHNHNVPEGSESHFKVVLVSKKFSGQTKVKRHQMVYATLSQELSGAVHALALHLYTPEEWETAAVPVSPKCMGGTGR